MHTIRALSLAPDARDWLTNSRHPRILHVFDYACNLLNVRREVLSIVTSQIGNGPFNIVVEDEVLFSEYLDTESTVSIWDNEITLDGLTINTTDAKLWSPRPDWEVANAKRGDILKQLTEIPITNYLKHGGFDTPLDDHSGLLNHQYLPILQFSNSLLSALVNAEITTAKTIASQLAGLGAGLTPAGDDFIMGAIYATWIIHPVEIAKVLAEEITNTAAPLTASLSAAWLRSAGRGEAGILWHQFFDALISDPARIQEAMDKILAVGESSGADAMAGFFGTFMCWAELATFDHVILSEAKNL